MRSVQDANIHNEASKGADLFSIVGVMLVDEFIQAPVGIYPWLAVQSVDDCATVGFGCGSLH
jgi:hypothetical protein